MVETQHIKTEQATLPDVATRELDLLLASRMFHPVYSGPALRFHKYASRLAERGVSMRVLTSVPRSDTHRSVCYSESVDGIPVHRVPLPSKKWRMQFEFQRQLLAYCRRPESRPDVIQLLSLPVWSLPWLARLRRLGIPMVFTHTLLKEMSGITLKRGIQRLSIKTPYQMMDCVVVSSQIMKDALLDMGVSTRIEIITNGLDTSRFKPAASPAEKRSLRQQLGLDPDGEIILFVGSIVARKGVDRLIEAWSLIGPTRRNAYLVLAGPKDGERGRLAAPNRAFQARIDRAVASSEAGNRIIFTGAVSSPESYFQAADIFVFPSLREGMPNVVLEAFGCGVASILTPFIGLPREFGNAGEQYILSDREPPELAKAIAKVLDNADLRHRLGAQARRWVAERMSIDRSVEQYADLYRELADQ